MLIPTSSSPLRDALHQLTVASAIWQPYLPPASLLLAGYSPALRIDNLVAGTTLWLTHARLKHPDLKEGPLHRRSAPNLAIWREFQQAGVEIPYPRRNIKTIDSATSTVMPSGQT